MDGTEYKITVSYDGREESQKKEKVYSGGLVKSYKYEYNSRNDISRKTEEVKQSDDYLKNVTDYKYDENGALIKLTVKSRTALRRNPYTPTTNTEIPST